MLRGIIALPDLMESSEDIDFSKPFSTSIIFEDDFDVDYDSGTSDSEHPAECIPVKIPSVDMCNGDGGSGTRHSKNVKNIVHEEECSEYIDYSKPFTTEIIFEDDFDVNCDSGISHSDLPAEWVPVKIPSVERSYKCHFPDCGRAFKQLSNLQQHLRNHEAQVKKAKNRQFHCNICSKAFATKIGWRTHIVKQHAALLWGANAFPCPLCHEVVSGGEAFFEHIKTTHKDPNAFGVASPPATPQYPEQTADHPYPVCWKHYVNESSLRKYFACHIETELSDGLRAWPCSVCQAVFTQESGLLSHIWQSLRKEPKHQQYVLSRAATEQCKCDMMAAVSGGGGAGASGALSMAPPSPAHPDSSANGRLTSTGSQSGAAVNELPENGHQYRDDRVAVRAAAVSQEASAGQPMNPLRQYRMRSSP